MKLLLTSGGVTNMSIAHALTELVNKESGIKIGFIPTAANAETNNKDWFIEQFTNLHKFGFTWIDIVDPSAGGVDWRARLAKVDVVFVGGGNIFHLLDQVRKTGFDQWVKEQLDQKVYAGISAGSIIATPSIAVAAVDNGDKNLPGLKDMMGLSLVDFEISPHTPGDVSYEGNAEYARTIKHKLYALDDQSAAKVDGNAIEIVSEGTYREYNS